jgi:hypothetical protein
MIRNLILRTGCSETVEIYRSEETDGVRGSISTQVNKIGSVLSLVESTGTLSKVQGLTLISKHSGDKINSVYIMYSEITDMMIKDIIKRTQVDGLDYEVKDIEINGKGSPLAHMKAYLVRIDNQ